MATTGAPVGSLSLRWQPFIEAVSALFGSSVSQSSLSLRWQPFIEAIYKTLSGQYGDCRCHYGGSLSLRPQPDAKRGRGRSLRVAVTTVAAFH